MPNGKYFDEEEAIGKVWTDTIYPKEFTNRAGKFFNIVTEEDGSQSVEYEHPPEGRNRIKLTLTFIYEDKRLGRPAYIKEVTLKKFKRRVSEGVPYWEEQHWGPENPIRFRHFTFERLTAFLKLLTELDLVNLNQRRIALREDTGQSYDAETAAKVRALLKLDDGVSIIDELLRNGSITSRDLVNIGYRKDQLAVFQTLLSRPEGIEVYREKHQIASPQPEKAWQHFFEKNEWIFGYGLDYRFLGILQREARVGEADIAGRDAPAVDYLMGASNFTVLVELKRHDTPLFESRKNRSGSWKLSAELVDAVSQILEQKASWQVHSAKSAKPFASDGSLITQRTADPKALLIIGSDQQFAGSDQERDIRLRTFELFRRDSRNIEILTFDELFERAKFIVGHIGSPA
jgi:hypothetical protein